MNGVQQLCHVGSVVVAPRLQSTGSTFVVHRLSCSKACGIFLHQGSNLCLLHWQADSLPLNHQGIPRTFLMSILSSSVMMDICTSTITNAMITFYLPILTGLQLRNSFQGNVKASKGFRRVNYLERLTYICIINIKEYSQKNKNYTFSCSSTVSLVTGASLLSQVGGIWHFFLYVPILERDNDKQN